MMSEAKGHFSFRSQRRSLRQQVNGAPGAPNPWQELLMNIALQQYVPAGSRPLGGKVSLVTGSTSGIGLGIARALAAAGSAIVLNVFGKPDGIAATQATLAAEGGWPVSYSGADMSRPESIRAMVEEILEQSGRLDVLVNNA